MQTKYKAVIFDLDGVIVSTDEYHYQAWKHLTNDEKIYFDRKINERLRGVSRMESLEIILERAIKVYTAAEKEELAARKNEYYKRLLENISSLDILPGVNNLLKELKKRNAKIAIGSSSKNTPIILERIGMSLYFDAIADGNGIKSSKPDPEVFLLAASLLEEDPKNCVVVEDSFAGIDAALAAGCKAIAVGYASTYEKADYAVTNLEEVDIEIMLEK